MRIGFFINFKPNIVILSSYAIRFSWLYNIINADGTYGRICNIYIDRLDEVYNVINYLNPLINKSSLLQIGVQSAPGLLMCINGEEIKVGRSGLYEILNGYKISFIGFIVEPDDNKYFILDYQY